jgi:hypothetical protein
MRAIWPYDALFGALGQGDFVKIERACGRAELVSGFWIVDHCQRLADTRLPHAPGCAGSVLAP